MGEHLLTCSASGLWIRHGDAARILLVVEQSPDVDPLVHGPWRVLTPPVRATFDGLGGFGDVPAQDRPILDLWMRQLRDEMIERPAQFPDRAGRDAQIRPGMSTDDLIACACAGRLSVRNRMGELGVRVAAVREDVWRRLVRFPQVIYAGPGVDGTALPSAVPRKLRSPYLWIDAAAHRWLARHLGMEIGRAYERTRSPRGLVYHEAFGPARLCVVAHWLRLDKLIGVLEPSAGETPVAQALIRSTWCGGTLDMRLDVSGVLCALVAFPVDRTTPPDVVVDAIGDLMHVSDALHRVRVGWRPAASHGEPHPDPADHLRFLDAIRDATIERRHADEDELDDASRGSPATIDDV